MRIITAAVILATAATASTTAFAQTRLSDAQFIKAARCSGLAGDGRFDAVINANKRGRDGFVIDKADENRQAAKREAKRASNGGKAQIEAELSGVCASLGA